MTGVEMIELMPPGYRFELLFAAYLKYALQGESDARERLDMLEMLDFLGEHPMPMEAIKSIEPMPAIGIEIMDTAFRADRDRDGITHGAASYKILSREDVFEKLVAINPSIMKAIAIYLRAPATFESALSGMPPFRNSDTTASGD